MRFPCLHAALITLSALLTSMAFLILVHINNTSKESLSIVQQGLVTIAGLGVCASLIASYILFHLRQQDLQHKKQKQNMVRSYHHYQEMMNPSDMDT